MMLITKEIAAKLDKNGAINAEHIARDGKTEDFEPVLKLFTPWGAGTWLITERDPENPDILFGLCDPGLGSPELGPVSLSELESLKGPFGLRIERDRHFKADKTLSAYVDEATEKGYILA